MRQTWTEKGLKYPEHRENDIIVVEQKNAQYFYFRTFQETREKKHTHISEIDFTCSVDQCDIWLEI